MPVVLLTIETGNNEDWIDSIKYVVDDGSADPPQLDLTGIQFEMEVRHRPTDHEVVFAASTTNSTIMVGAPPDNGFLVIQVPLDPTMRPQEAGSYVADIVGHDGTYTRVVAQIALTIVEGITRQPANNPVVVLNSPAVVKVAAA